MTSPRTFTRCGHPPQMTIKIVHEPAAPVHWCSVCGAFHKEPQFVPVNGWTEPQGPDGRGIRFL